MKSKFGSLSNLIKKARDNWFLITLAGSVLASIFYMVVFHVSPLDTYYEIKDRREQARFHKKVGFHLLDNGHYLLAKIEFENALKLQAVDHDALNGRYWSELFLSLASPDWDAAVGTVVKNYLNELGAIEKTGLRHIVEKYQGDVQRHVGALEVAKQHYEKALSIKPRYQDALYTYGWVNYRSIHDSDIQMMERNFRKMTENDRYDYRGFHGLGYALYMQAIIERDLVRRKELIEEAAQLSKQAGDLSINYINILSDFGEIARSASPETSIQYHEYANQVLDDPSLNKLSINRGTLLVKLLVHERNTEIYINEWNEKRAWITYQLALDYLSQYRMQRVAKDKTQHDSLLARAKTLDKDGKILPIYKDQLAILNILLPPEKINERR